MSDHRQTGFTLIEMLVAMLLFALLMTGLAETLRLGARVWEARLDRLGDVAQLDAARTILRHALARAAPVRPAARPGEKPRPLAFAGESQSLRLVVGGLSQSAFGGFDLVELALEPHQGGQRLVLRRQPWNDQPGLSRPGLGEPETIVLLDRLKGGGFRYRKAGPGSWHDQWDDPDHLPALVAVELDLPAGRGAWVELMVRPRMGVPPGQTASATSGELPAFQGRR